MPWLDDNSHLRRSFDLTDFAEASDGLAVDAQGNTKGQLWEWK